jgi:hypothetical protein
MWVLRPKINDMQRHRCISKPHREIPPQTFAYLLKWTVGSEGPAVDVPHSLGTVRMANVAKDHLQIRRHIIVIRDTGRTTQPIRTDQCILA